MPRRRAIISVRTRRRHTVAEVTALTDTAFAVDRALWARLTEEAVADRARRAVGVYGALTEVNAAIAQALEARLAVSVRGTLDRGLTCAGDRLALLHWRAVRVTRAATRDDAAVVLTGLTSVAVSVDAAITDEDTLIVDALLVRRAVRVREALRRLRLTRTIDALFTREAVKVAEAIWSERDALTVLTELVRGAIEVVEASPCGLTDTAHTVKARAAVDAGAEIDALAAEVRADLVRSALVIRAAITDEEARVVQADFARVTVHVHAAAERWHAVPITTNLIDAAVPIDPALSLEDALTVDADLAAAAVEVIEALRGIVHAAHVHTELVDGAIEVCTAARDRYADSVLTHLAVGAIIIGAAADKLAPPADARAAEAAVSIDGALGDERTGAPKAGEVLGAIGGRRALTEVCAATVITEPTLPTVIVRAALGEAALAVIADREADTGLRAVRVTATLFDIEDALTRVTGRAIRALEVEGALPDLRAEPIIADLTRSAVEVLQALAELTDAVGADGEAAAEIGAVIVVEALDTDRQALAVEADVARATLGVRFACAWLDARLAIADLSVRAVDVRLALGAALALDAALALITHRVIEALGRCARFAHAICAEERPRHGVRIERVAVIVDLALGLGVHVAPHPHVRRDDVLAGSRDAGRPVRAVSIRSTDERDRAVVPHANRSLTTLGVGLAALAQGRSPTAL